MRKLLLLSVLFTGLTISGFAQLQKNTIRLSGLVDFDTYVDKYSGQEYKMTRFTGDARLGYSVTETIAIDLIFIGRLQKSISTNDTTGVAVPGFGIGLKKYFPITESFSIYAHGMGLMQTRKVDGEKVEKASYIELGLGVEYFLKPRLSVHTQTSVFNYYASNSLENDDSYQRITVLGDLPYLLTNVGFTFWFK